MSVVANVLDFSHSDRYTLLFHFNLQFLNVMWYEYFCVIFCNLSSLVEIFSLFLNWVILLISSFIDPLHILITSVYQIWFFPNIFSQSVTYSFILWTMPVGEQIFNFYVSYKKSLSSPSSSEFFPMCTSVLNISGKFYETHEVCDQIYLFFLTFAQMFQHHLMKRLCFFHRFAFASF